MSIALILEAGCTIFGLMIFTMAMLALFVGARIVGTHPILRIVQVASIGGVTLAIGAIFLILVPIAALSLIRVVAGLRLLHLAASTTFTTAALLWGTASFIFDWFNFFFDSENEIGKEFILERWRTSQIVNRRRGTVKLLAMEVQIRLRVKSQIKCVLNDCWFNFSHLPPNDRFGQLLDECGEEELIAQGSVGTGLPCRVMECPVESGDILTRKLAKKLDLGPQNVGVRLVVLPKETPEFIIVAFLGNGGGPVKMRASPVRRAKKKCMRELGVRAAQLESV